MTKKQKEVKKAKQPSLAKYKLGALQLYGTFNEKEVTAKVRENGVVVFDSVEYSSPSKAVSVAMGRATSESVNGFMFWKVKQGGELVALDTLRKK